MSDIDYDTLMYVRYRLLGGKKMKQTYLKVLNTFVLHTHNAYIENEVLDTDNQKPYCDNNNFWIYANKYDSFNGFMEHAFIRDWDEALLIFNSVNQILQYS